jgi:hypothetical protein
MERYDAMNTEYDENFVRDNAGHGYRRQISGAAIIRDNILVAQPATRSTRTWLVRPRAVMGVVDVAMFGLKGTILYEELPRAGY